MSSPQVAPKYSVLILGSTQAGKSALIDHIRSYADPGYVIDESLLGDRITSKTDTTTPVLIKSNLPTYEAYRKDTGVAFELENFTSQYKDEEDYRDALLSHSDNVGMRLVPQDTAAPSGSMEFQLLDTPGFNGTLDRDSEHATSIVNKVISTRSFNLIVFVISSKSLLTEKMLLALEYFAYVHRGLHSRIVFLYTHVDYADTHHSNTAHHLDMSVRSKTISRIFRRHDGEPMIDEFNITEYPCFNIDLTTGNGPIVQCMIRNTIRKILTMATAPPVVLDTSTSNIDRIRAVAYPIELGQEQRENLEATIRKNLPKPKYSVLIIGKTQAGKSTLIEHIKNYVNPSYAIDKSLLGNGDFSKTESTRSFYVESNLPVYEVYRKDTGEVIDLEDLPSKFDDEEDYRDILFSRERDVGLRQAPQDRRNPVDNIEFRLLDSLGLENAHENDSNHAAMIINKLIHIQTFNLIVITESYKNLLTQEQQLELEYFANVFRGLHSRIMFLHTHVDYTNIHPTNSTHHRNMRMKNKALSKLFRRHDNEVPFDENKFEEYPSLTIDLVSMKRPVINCLIQNTIREILKMATRPAVIFDTSIHNIERIRAIPYPTQMTVEQLKQAKARLQADADKVEEEHTEEQAEEREVEDVEDVVHETTTQTKDVVVEEETQQETVVTEVVVETGSIHPAVSKGTSWFKNTAGGAVAVVAGAAITHGAHHVASGAGHAALGALEKVDGVWKRTVQILTTRKAHVDAVAPIAKTSYVYYDEEVYDSVLVEKATGIIYVTQLLFDTETHAYYVYVRWGETDYKLDGPHDTIEAAKSAFQVTYKERFGLEWETRETTVSEQWTYEVKTYETYEEIECVEEVVEETEAQLIIKKEQDVVVSEDVTVHEETTITTTTEEVTLEHIVKEVAVVEETEKEVVQDVTVTKAVGVVKKPAAPKGTSWFKKVVGAGSAASGALEKVDGVWKRTVQVLTTRKAHVDAVAPIAKTSYVYYDEDVYDSVLVEKSTGVTYVTQLLFDTETHAYYVYVRWGETDYKLGGPHETIESAKSAFQISYKERFGLEWEKRETTVSEQWTYETKTYETYEEIEYVEEVVEETQAVAPIEQEREIVVREQSEHIAVVEGEEIIKVVTIVKDTCVVAQPAVSKGSSWFRLLAAGAGAVASGALTQVDGVWKRTVQVLTTRKAHVDAVAPIAQTSYVYYDDEVYDSVLTEKSTGVTYVTQLLYDTQVKAYYVYVRWGETDYKLDGPHKTIEAAKAAFHVTYKERFGLEWETRETTVSERWTYEVKTYEAFEETEYIEEVVEDYEVKEIVAREQKVIVEGKVVSTEQSVSSSHDDTVVRTVSEQVVSQEGSASSSSRGGVFGFGGSSSSEYTQTQSEEETKKPTFLANLPTLNAGINADTGAAIGVIDLTSGTAETLRELPAHLRPRAWVSLHVGGWQNAPHELQGFMRLDDQSGQRLMESARDEAQVNAQEAIPIENLSLPEIVGLFAQKLYGRFGMELPKKFEIERLRYVTEECGESGKVIGAVDTGNVATTTRHGTKMVGSGRGSRGEESSLSRSVLILGKTQAGKSTFIEFVKNYANQQYTIDESLLGTRFKSKTRMPRQCVVKTELQAYEVFDANGTRIDIGSLGDQYQDPDDYLDALNDRKTTLKSVSHDHDSSPLPRDVEITFLDTPGVEDTNGKDAEHAKRIIDAMTQLQSFNLIIIVINCEETPSKAHQLAFSYYSKVIHNFQGHHSNIVFLYTHVEYEKCHHSNADYLSVMKLRHKAFSQLFRCQGSYNYEDVSKAAVETYPMYNIDFDKRQRPIKKCMRLMTLRAILAHIVNSPAVALDTSASNLQQIQAITHPDELNHALRKKLPEVTHAILEQEQGPPQDDFTLSVVPRNCPMTLGVNSSGAFNKDRATDLVASVRDDDYDIYFSETMSDCSSSGEDDDFCSDALDSGASTSHLAKRHCDDMSKMVLAVVQEQ